MDLFGECKEINFMQLWRLYRHFECSAKKVFRPADGSGAQAHVLQRIHGPV